MRRNLLPLSAALALAAVPAARARSKDRFHNSWRALEKAEAALEAATGQPVAARFRAQVAVAQAARQVLDGARAAAAYRAALALAGPRQPQNLGTHAQLLQAIYDAQILAGDPAAAAATAADLRGLLEGAQGPKSTGALEWIYREWRARELAGDPQAEATAKALETRAPNHTWSRRIAMARRGGPGVRVSLRGPTRGASFFVDPRDGRPMTGAFPHTRPFHGGAAVYQEGAGYGLFDTRMRPVVPPRYSWLNPIEGHPGRFLARRTTGENGAHRMGVLDAAGREVIPLVYERAENSQTGVVRLKRAADAPPRPAEAPVTAGGTEFRRVSDGGFVDTSEYYANERRYEAKRSPFYPYRAAPKKAPVMLKDPAGKIVFPPTPLPPGLAGFRRVVAADGPRVVARVRGEEKGATSALVIYDLEKAAVTLPATRKVRKLGRFTGGAAVAELDGGARGIVGPDGAWILEPKTRQVKDLDPTAGYFRLHQRAGARLVRPDGTTFSAHAFGQVAEPEFGCLPVTVRQEKSPVALGTPRYWAPNVLGPAGEPLWPPGRLRMVDNRLSITLRENMDLAAFDLNRVSLSRPAQRRGYLTPQTEYSHSAEIHVAAFDRGADPKPGALRAAAMASLVADGPRFTVTAGPPLAVGARSWQRFSAELADPKIGGFRILEGATWLGPAEGFAMVVLGVRRAKDAGEGAAIKARLEDLVRTARFPGEDGF